MWESAETGQHWRAQLMHARERQLHLGLDAGDLGEAEAGRPSSGVPQQLCLPGAGLTVDDEHRTPPAERALQEPVQGIPLTGPVTERRRARNGHRRADVATGGRPPEDPG